MSDILLATKLHIPPLQGKLVNRPHLIRRLNDGIVQNRRSILEQLTAPALLGRHDSQAILDQVEQANLFLIPLDDERQWYRYHHLLAELLRKCLRQTRPDHITELLDMLRHFKGIPDQEISSKPWLSMAVTRLAAPGFFPLPV